MIEEYHKTEQAHRSLWFFIHILDQVGPHTTRLLGHPVSFFLLWWMKIDLRTVNEQLNNSNEASFPKCTNFQCHMGIFVHCCNLKVLITKTAYHYIVVVSLISQFREFVIISFPPNCISFTFHSKQTFCAHSACTLQVQLFVLQRF